MAVQYIAMNLLERLGRRIGEIRKIKVMTQEELAERSGLTLSYMVKIETARRSPSLATIEKIADGLGVGVHELFVSLEPELMSNRSLVEKIEELTKTLKGRIGHG